MEKTIKINNMNCEHCSSKVKEALLALPGVEDVSVSLFRKKATVKGENLEDDVLKNAIETAGYEVVSIK